MVFIKAYGGFYKGTNKNGAILLSELHKAVGKLRKDVLRHNLYSVCTAMTTVVKF